MYNLFIYLLFFYLSGQSIFVSTLMLFICVIVAVWSFQASFIFKRLLILKFFIFDFGCVRLYSN